MPATAVQALTPNPRLPTDNALVQWFGLRHTERMSESNENVVVTARFLTDGAPAYLRADGTWSRALQEAQVMSEERGAAEASERAKHEQPLVADPYTFRVALTPGGLIDALSARERIRSTGPTVRIRRPD